MRAVSTGYDTGTLGWWMDERRGELDLPWKQVAERTGVSEQHIYRIARGDVGRMRATTKKAIERALRWANGSVDRIAAGREPVPVADSPPDEREPALSPEVRRRLAAMSWPEIKQRLIEEEEMHGAEAAEWLMRQIAFALEDAQKG